MDENEAKKGEHVEKGDLVAGDAPGTAGSGANVGSEIAGAGTRFPVVSDGDDTQAWERDSPTDRPSPPAQRD